MMLNFLKWPSPAFVPSLELCLRTLWMPVLGQQWRSRYQWMHRATLTPNQSTLPSECTVLSLVICHPGHLANRLLFQILCPNPFLTSFTLCSISLPEKLEYIANKYAEHSHDKWSSEKVCLNIWCMCLFYTWRLFISCEQMLSQVSAGWKPGDSVDDQAKTHPLLKPYKSLSDKVYALGHIIPVWI